MQVVPAVFSDKTFTYTKVERQGMWAIYEQRHKESGVCRYELVRIRVRAEQTWPDGRITPEHEAYPGSSSWGVDGFTHYKEEGARAHMVRLIAERAMVA